ncbi:MAG: lysostaphin resistance A-like protein [Acidimicrobiales bacterium]
MSDIEPGEAEATTGPAPAQPPGQVPAGYVPREWLSAQVIVPRAGGPAVGPPVGTPAGPPDGTPVGPPVGPPVAPPTGSVNGDGPFLDRPWIPPVDRRQAWRWLLYAFAGFIVGQLLAAVFGLVAGAIAGKTSLQMSDIASASVPPEWYIVSTLAGLWIGFFGAPWLASRTQGTRHFVSDLGLRFRVIDLVGIAVGIGGQIAVGIMYAPFQHDIHDFNAPSQKLTGASHGGGFLVIAVATVIVAPFMEELFFRGLLLKALVRLFTPAAAWRARGLGVVLAVIVDGVLFGLAHGEWVQLAGLALFGVVLAAISYRTGRLGMNMVAHATFNLVAIVAIAGQGGLIH